MKKCSLCNEIKEFSEFWKRTSRKSGYISGCKTCWSEKRREKRRENPEEIRRKRREYYEKNKAYLIAIQKKYYKNATHQKPKIIARRRLNDAIKLGNIKKLSFCQICGVKPKRIEGHHADYEKPLSVIWLCSVCHTNIHHPG